MSYYKVCPYCGAALDPCELCDCRSSNSQTAENLDKKKLPGATNAEQLKETQHSS